MNSLQIQYFLALCQYQNFTKTAEKLYVAQPSLSKQIASLEKELGFRLFERNYKSISLTKEGDIIRRALEQNQQCLQRAKESAYQSLHPNEYILKFAVLQGLDIVSFLRPLLNPFEEENPAVHIDVDCLSHKELSEQLHLNNLDFAISVAQFTENDEMLYIRPIHDVKLAITMHRTHPLYAVPRVTPKDLSGQTILVCGKDVRGFSHFMEQLNAQKLTQKAKIVHVNSMDDLISAMTGGFGIAIMSHQARFCTHPYRQIPLDGTMEHVTLSWHYNNTNPARQFFLDYLETHYEKSPA